MFKKKNQEIEVKVELPKNPGFPKYLYAKTKRDYLTETDTLVSSQNREDFVPSVGDAIIGVYQLVEKQRVFKNTIVESIPLP